MQVANCNLRLNGDINNEIFKPAVTVAEIVILRAIHGADAVVNIQPLRNDKREHAKELNRLKDEYGDKVFSAVFPGSYPKLPIYFKDVGIDIDFNDDKPAGRKTAKPAAAAANENGSASAGEGEGDDNGGDAGGED